MVPFSTKAYVQICYNTEYWGGAWDYKLIRFNPTKTQVLLIWLGNWARNRRFGLRGGLVRRFCAWYSEWYLARTIWYMLLLIPHMVEYDAHDYERSEAWDILDARRGRRFSELLMRRTSLSVSYSFPKKESGSFAWT